MPSRDPTSLDPSSSSLSTSTTTTTTTRSRLRSNSPLPPPSATTTSLRRSTRSRSNTPALGTVNNSTSSTSTSTRKTRSGSRQPSVEPTSQGAIGGGAGGGGGGRGSRANSLAPPPSLPSTTSTTKGRSTRGGKGKGKAVEEEDQEEETEGDDSFDHSTRVKVKIEEHDEEEGGREVDAKDANEEVERERIREEGTDSPSTKLDQSSITTTTIDGHAVREGSVESELSDLPETETEPQPQPQPQPQKTTQPDSSKEPVLVGNDSPLSDLVEEEGENVDAQLEKAEVEVTSRETVKDKIGEEEGKKIDEEPSRENTETVDEKLEESGRKEDEGAEREEDPLQEVPKDSERAQQSTETNDVQEDVKTLDGEKAGSEGDVVEEEQKMQVDAKEGESKKSENEDNRASVMVAEGSEKEQDSVETDDQEGLRLTNDQPEPDQDVETTQLQNLETPSAPTTTDNPVASDTVSSIDASSTLPAKSPTPPASSLPSESEPPLDVTNPSLPVETASSVETAPTSPPAPESQQAENPPIPDLDDSASKPETEQQTSTARLSGSPPNVDPLEIVLSPSPLSTLKEPPPVLPSSDSATSTSDSKLSQPIPSTSSSSPLITAAKAATNGVTGGMSIKPPQVRVQSMTPKDVRRRFNGHKITCVGMLNNELIKIAGELVVQRPINMVEYAPLLERLQSNLKYLAAMAAQQQKKDNARKPPEPPILNLPSTPLLSNRLNPLYTSLKQYFYAAEKYELQQAQLSGNPAIGGGGGGERMNSNSNNGATGGGGGVNTLVTTTVTSNPGIVAASHSVGKVGKENDGKKEPILTSKPETTIPSSSTTTSTSGMSSVNGVNKRAREEETQPSRQEREPELKKTKIELEAVPEGQVLGSQADQSTAQQEEEEEEEVVPANKIAQPTPTVITTSIQPRPQSRQMNIDVPLSNNNIVSSPQPAAAASPIFQTPSVPPPSSQQTQSLARPRAETPSNPFPSQAAQPPARPPSAQRNQAYGSAIPAHVQQGPGPATPVQANRMQPPHPNVNSAFAQLTPQQQNYVRQQQYQAMLAQQQAMNQASNPLSTSSLSNHSVAPSPRMTTTVPPHRPTSAMSHSSPYATNAPSPATSIHSASASQPLLPPSVPSQTQQQPVEDQQRPLAEKYAGIQSIISAPTFRQLPPALQQNLQQQAQSLLYQMQAATMAMARNANGPAPPPQNRNVSPAHPQPPSSAAVSSPRNRMPSYSQSPQVQNAQVPPQARMNSVGPQSQYAGSYVGSMSGSMAGSPPSNQRPNSAMSSGNYPQDSASLFREQLAQQNAIRAGSPAHGVPANYNQYAGHQRAASNSYGQQAPSPAASVQQAYSHQSPAPFTAPSPAQHSHQQQQHQSSIYPSAAPSPAASINSRSQQTQPRQVSAGNYQNNPSSPFYPNQQNVPSRPPSQSSYPQHQQQSQPQPQHTQQPLAPPPVPQPKPVQAQQQPSIPVNPSNPVDTSASPSPFLSNANPASTMWTPTNVGTPSLGVGGTGSSTDLWGNSSGLDPFSIDSNDHSKVGGAGDDAWSEWLNL